MRDKLYTDKLLPSLDVEFSWLPWKCLSAQTSILFTAKQDMKMTDSMIPDKIKYGNINFANSSCGQQCAIRSRRMCEPYERARV